jgi:hypothetical protein
VDASALTADEAIRTVMGLLSEKVGPLGGGDRL